MLKETINTDSVLVKKIKEFAPDIKTGKKAQVLERINKSFITTASGYSFDADEDSQNRMTRAITIMKHKNMPDVQWKLYDNTIQTVQLDELVEALELAGQNQTNLWFH